MNEAGESKLANTCSKGLSQFVFHNGCSEWVQPILHFVDKEKNEDKFTNNILHLTKIHKPLWSLGLTLYFVSFCPMCISRVFDE